MKLWSLVGRYCRECSRETGKATGGGVASVAHSLIEPARHYEHEAMEFADADGDLEGDSDPRFSAATASVDRAWGDDGDGSDGDGGGGGDWCAGVEVDPTEDEAPCRGEATHAGCVASASLKSTRRATSRSNDVELGRAWWGGAGPVRGEWRLPASEGAWRNPHLGFEHAVRLARGEQSPSSEGDRFVLDVPFWVAATRIPPFDHTQPGGFGGPLAGHVDVWRAASALSLNGLAEDEATVAAAAAEPCADLRRNTDVAARPPRPRDVRARARRQALILHEEKERDVRVMRAALDAVSGPTRAWWARCEAALLECLAAELRLSETKAAWNSNNPAKSKRKLEHNARARAEHQVPLLHRLARTTAYLGGCCPSVTDETLERAPRGIHLGFARSPLTPLQCLAARGDPAPLSKERARAGAIVNGDFAPPPPPAEVAADVSLAFAANKAEAHVRSHLYDNGAGAVADVDVANVEVADAAGTASPLPRDWRLRFDKVVESPMRIAVAANHLAFVARALALFGGPYFRFAAWAPCARRRGGVRCARHRDGALHSRHLGGALHRCEVRGLRGFGRRRRARPLGHVPAAARRLLRALNGRPPRGGRSAYALRAHTRARLEATRARDAATAVRRGPLHFEHAVPGDCAADHTSLVHVRLANGSVQTRAAISRNHASSATSRRACVSRSQYRRCRMDARCQQITGRPSVHVQSACTREDH